MVEYRHTSTDFYINKIPRRFPSDGGLALQFASEQTISKRATASNRLQGHRFELAGSNRSFTCIGLPNSPDTQEGWGYQLGVVPSDTVVFHRIPP